jgi:hypothetical protein
MQDGVNTVQVDLNTELENLRLELRQIQGAHKLVQDESVDASHQAGAEAQASKDADKKSRLEQLFELQDNSYLTFTWEEIDNATSSFSESHKIGTGSTGTVYKGHLNNLDVAIKVLHSNDSTSTKHFNKEVLPEVCASSSNQFINSLFKSTLYSIVKLCPIL